jgi:hypothetical protein
MARWSRSRLRTFGVGAVALLGASLLIVPAISQAEDEPVRPRPAAVKAADRVSVIAGKKGRSAFEFKPGSGDRHAPYSFVSTGGSVRVRQMGEDVPPAAQARTGAPPPAARAAAAAATYRTTLTVTSQNWSAWHKTINLWNRDTWTYVPVTNPESSLSATANLPPGNYYATATYGIYGVNSYLLTKAFTVTTRAQTVTLDESSAKETAIVVDDTTARREMSAVWMSLPGGDLVGFAGGPHTRTYVTTASVPGTTLRVHEVLVKAGSTALKPSPYRYDLMRFWPHPIPASPIKAVTTASLAKTTTTVRSQGTTTDGAYQTVPSLGEWTGVYLPSTVRFPATFTEYITPNVTLSRLVSYGDGQSLSPADRMLSTGTHPGETVGAGPLVPTGRPWGDDSRRDQNRLQITENMTLGDAAGNKGSDHSATTSITLSSGGEVLKTANGVTLIADVPSLQQTYRLQQTTTRKVGWSQLSTKITSDWTFRSAGPSYAKLPLMDLAIAASGLDQRNRAGAAPVGLTVRPSTRQIPAVDTVDRLEWSADDGVTWTELPLTESADGAAATLEVPPTAAFVSLRVTASNDQGGALRRTVLRALAGPATPGDETAGGTRISDVEVNGGKPLVFGTSGSAEFTATFTATDPSGIAGAGLTLWHGAYNAPDGLQLSRTECTAVDDTTSRCTAYLYLYDARYVLSGNALAGVWRAEAWASAKDGTGFADRLAAGSVAIKRATALTADATPEPVVNRRTVTVAGTLTRADWDTGTVKPYASQPVTLQWIKRGTTTWTSVRTVKTDTAGKLKATATATADGSYRLTYAGDAASGPITSAADYVDVQ